ncbi:MAG: amino acid permease [Thermodesulfobacteriota bacterium]
MVEDSKKISLTGGVCFTVGLVIGPSIFVIIPTLAGMTGPSLYLAYLAAAVPALFTCLYLIQLSGALPVTGANYVVITRALSPMAGFATSICLLLALISTNALVCWGLAQYVGVYFPGLSKIGLAVAALLLFTVINYLGLEIYEWIQILMVFLLLAVMLVFGAGGSWSAQAALQTPLFPKGTGGFLMVVGVAAFSFAGFPAISEIGGDIRNPKRNIPLALIIALIIITAIYVLQTYAFTGNLAWSEAARIGATAVLAAAGKFLPEWAVTLVAVAAILAMTTTLNSILLMSTREITAWSRDNVVPPVFGRIHPRFKTPHVALVSISILTLVGVLFAAELDKYALIVVFSLMVIQGLAATATWLLPRRMPEIQEKALIKFTPFWRGFTWIGCLICFSLVFAFGLLADLKTGIVFAAAWGLGLVYWYIRASMLSRRGLSIEAGMHALSEAMLAEMEEK